MNTIQSEWTDYATLALPAEALRVQRRETRRAFYAGYLAALSQISQLTIETRKGVTTETGAQAIMEGIKEELRAFARAVQADAD